MTGKPRYYYTDPLAAAFMAKHFGVKFSAYPLSPRVDAFNIKPYFDKNGDLCFCLISQEGKHQLFHDKLYIHPDSLHLLEPQVGDLTMYKFIEQGGCVITPAWFSEHLRKEQVESIIQRNGIAFMWPEVEK